MNLATNAPKRPALRYYGGKWDIAPWTIGHMPPHANYVEPFFGAGSVLLRKPAVKLETVNDLDGRVVNFFKMLRDRPKELIAKIDLTPWAREEYLLSGETAADPIEDARRFFCLCWMSIQGGPVATKSSFRYQNQLAGRYQTPCSDLTNHALTAVAARLRNVQILNIDAVKMLDKYKNAPDALIYLDPPYLQDTRGRKRNGYNNESSIGLHERIAAAVKALPGRVMIAGYDSPLYHDLYSANGWRMERRPFQTNSGAARVECLWLSPNIELAQMRLI